MLYHILFLCCKSFDLVKGSKTGKSRTKNSSANVGKQLQKAFFAEAFPSEADNTSPGIEKHDVVQCCCMLPLSCRDPVRHQSLQTWNAGTVKAPAFQIELCSVHCDASPQKS